MSKIFVDTNILVYCMDDSDKKRTAQCRSLIETLVGDLYGVISTQVLQEFYVVATKKLAADPLAVKDILHSFRRFETVVVTPEIIKDAIDCSLINRLSFWDALIVAAAESARCEKIWTEDLNDGQILRGVRIENPLRSLKSE
jgi:predicted nucleic acid-binding protein